MGQIQSTYTPFFNSCWNTWIIWFKKNSSELWLSSESWVTFRQKETTEKAIQEDLKKNKKQQWTHCANSIFFFFFIRFLEIQPKTTSLTCLVLMGNRWPQFTQKCSSVTTWSSDFINGLSYDHVFFFPSGHIQQFSCIFFFLQFCLLNKAQRAILASDDKMYPSGAGADPSGQWWCQDTPWMVCISWPHRETNSHSVTFGWWSFITPDLTSRQHRPFLH